MIMRLNFRCWNCLREYFMTREIDGQPQILVACPYCGAEAVADLNPYRNHTTVVYQGEDQPAAQPAPTYNFPPAIPTAPPTPSEPGA